ncbi:hypothetical protein [Massilia horti]|uniref:Uncharacterized protein n=1 Tax=Massilia horti TaxID=2562153 RepID=A0A4Y9T6B4_9BURK|nr:hypothetical protein [Massilia horti]TFW36045.1 hypothetical protein E4O92_00630 [Massilia horti]
MRQSLLTLHAAGMACALCLTAAPALAHQSSSADSAVPPAVAKQQKAEIRKGAPARWFQGDHTHAQREAILKKEIAAAYSQQKNECHRHPSAQRTSCLKEARNQYQHDMSSVPTLLAQGPTPAIVERTNVDLTAPGAAQYGGSQSGATQAQPGTQPATQQQEQPRNW